MNPESSTADAELAGAPPFRVGAWLVRPDLNRLDCDGKSARIEPRVMQVLVALARRPGEVVTRDAILTTVWEGVVVQEEALTHAISRLRRVFGDDPKSARFIETIPKRGYRLMAKVTPAETPASPAAPPQAAPDRPFRIGHLTFLLLIAAAIIAIVGAGGWFSDRAPASLVLEGKPFTSFPGREITPAVSPDGTRVAFAWNSEEGTGFDLYVKQREVETPLRLTADPGHEHSPEWSPDGSRLAYVGVSDGRSVVNTIPAVGGTPRQVFEAPEHGGVQDLDWDPTSDRLVLSTFPEPGGKNGLLLLSLKSLESRPIATTQDGIHGDTLPAYAPDGRLIAFARGDAIGLQDIYLVDAGGEKLRRLTSTRKKIRGLDWTPDGEALIVSCGPAPTGEFRLYRVSLDDGALCWLPTSGRRVLEPSLATQDGCLVYQEEEYHCHLTRMPISRSPVRAEDLPRFAPSSRSDYGARYSPSGNRVAFISMRSGAAEVWICDGDGKNPRQVTSFGGAYVENVRWSYDEDRVAFNATPGDYSAVYVAEIETGMTRRVTSLDRHEEFLCWSHEKNQLYYKGRHEESWQTYRATLGGEEEELVLPFELYMLSESDRGDALFYVKADAPGFWTSAKDGANESLVFTEPAARLACYWKVTAEGVFLFRTTEGPSELAFFDFATKQAESLCPLPSVQWILLDVAPDGKSLLYDRVDRIETDLVIVDGFAEVEG